MKEDRYNQVIDLNKSFSQSAENHVINSVSLMLKILGQQLYSGKKLEINYFSLGCGNGSDSIHILNALVGQLSHSPHFKDKEIHYRCHAVDSSSAQLKAFKETLAEVFPGGHVCQEDMKINIEHIFHHQSLQGFVDQLPHPHFLSIW